MDMDSLCTAPRGIDTKSLCATPRDLAIYESICGNEKSPGIAVGDKGGIVD